MRKGNNIMKGYWGDPEETARVLRDDGLHTGDMAWMDEEGYLYIAGRKSEMIKSGGHRISPKEIEETILELPAVHEVAVVGVEDEILGESITAYVVPKELCVIESQDVQRHCMETAFRLSGATESSLPGRITQDGHWKGKEARTPVNQSWFCSSPSRCSPGVEGRGPRRGPRGENRWTMCLRPPGINSPGNGSSSVTSPWGTTSWTGWVRSLKENPSIRLTIVETTDPSRFDAPVFAHARVGRNGDPGSKCEAFEQYMDSGIGSRADIAFFKFCYVDINRETDVGKMFESYKATVRRVKTKYPGLTLVHVTVPLTSTDYTLKVRLKTFVKGILGRKDENVGRGELNERIRKEFGGSDPIFDLAAIESTSPAGEPVTFTYQGKKYPCMYPGYTTDGGHLNSEGKRVVAVGLLQTLLRVVEKEKAHP